MNLLALLSLVVAAAVAVDAQSLPVGQAGRDPWGRTAAPVPHWKTWTSPPANLDKPTATPVVAASTPAVAKSSSSDSETRPFPVDDTAAATPVPSASANTTTNLTTAPPTNAPSATTPAPTNSTSETRETPAPSSAAPTETPAPTPYVPPPVPAASEDSPTFRLVETALCDSQVASAIEAIYTKNRALFDTCAKDSQYQIFPFNGIRPTPEQIHALATSKACTVLFTACVVADLPECEITGISLKAVTETLLKVAVDVAHGKPSPDTERFHDMHIWRRDSNLAKAAGVPNGNDSALYAEYARDLPEALAEYSVALKGDLSIVNASEEAKDYSFGSADGDARDVAGEVHANDGAVDDGTSLGKSGNSTNTVVKTLSGAQPEHGAIVGSLAAVAVAVTLTWMS